MVFATATTKAARLIAVQRLFARQPERIRPTAEIAAHLGVSPRATRNYLNELSADGTLPLTLGRGGWGLVPDARFTMPPVSFRIEEAAACYLAARLLCRHVDEPNPAVRGAVAKLASVVPENLGAVMDRLVARLDPSDGGDGEVFRVMATGWALRRAVDIRYQSVGASEPRGHRLRIYLLEPAVRGFSLYAIGEVNPGQGLRVFKLERVSEARLSDETFKAPDPEELLTRLDASWGVWLSDGEAQEVVLRFTPEVARPVRETRWHLSQRLTDLPDGGIELRLVLPSTPELLPWILSWGGSCEVVSPASLREQTAAELTRGIEHYR